MSRLQKGQTRPGMHPALWPKMAHALRWLAINRNGRGLTAADAILALGIQDPAQMFRRIRKYPHDHAQFKARDIPMVEQWRRFGYSMPEGKQRDEVLSKTVVEFYYELSEPEAGCDSAWKAS